LISVAGSSIEFAFEILSLDYGGVFVENFFVGEDYYKFEEERSVRYHF
jgi:hypothetical protein